MKPFPPRALAACLLLSVLSCVAAPPPPPAAPADAGAHHKLGMIEQNAPVPFKQVFSVPATASTTTIGTPFQNFGPADKLVIFAAIQGMSASTLDLYLQESWDGGATWTDAAHFPQLAGAAPAVTKRVVTSNPASGASTTVGTGTGGGSPSATVALAADKYVDSPWGPLLRVISVTGTGANGGAVNQTFTFVPWQQSH